MEGSISHGGDHVWITAADFAFAPRGETAYNGRRAPAGRPGLKGNSGSDRVLNLISGIAAVVAPAFLVTLCGFIWAKIRLPFDQVMVTKLNMLIATPALIFATMSKMQIPLSGLERMGLAALVCHVLFVLVGLAALKTGRLRIAVYLPSLIFPNIGNMGLPVCLFAFGQSGLALAMIYMSVTTVGQFTVGPAMAAGRFSARQIMTHPFFYALGVALVVSLAEIPVPAWMHNSATLAGNLSVPLMLLSLGVALGQLRVHHFRRALVLSVVRVVGGGLVGWTIATAFGLDGAYRGVLVIQSFMPTAVYNYLFALMAQREPEEVASMILVSTGLAYVLLPFLVAFLI